METHGAQWALFSPVGEVLELAILRSQGRSKGCAFLTYATRQQARRVGRAAIGLGCRCAHAAAAAGPPPDPCPRPRPPQALAAIHAFNGRPVAHNKRLVVKFADQKAATPASAPALEGGGQQGSVAEPPAATDAGAEAPPPQAAAAVAAPVALEPAAVAVGGA